MKTTVHFAVINFDLNQNLEHLSADRAIFCASRFIDLGISFLTPFDKEKVLQFAKMHGLSVSAANDFFLRPRAEVPHIIDGAYGEEVMKFAPLLTFCCATAFVAQSRIRELQDLLKMAGIKSPSIHCMTVEVNNEDLQPSVVQLKGAA